jgi:hypothetical protein
VLLALVLLIASSVSLRAEIGAVRSGDQDAARAASHHCGGDTADRSTPSPVRDHGAGCPCCFHGSCSCSSSAGAILADLPAMRAIAPTDRLLVCERRAWSAPPIDEHLRPPIV